jgi:hypothetical protein
VRRFYVIGAKRGKISRARENGEGVKVECRVTEENPKNYRPVGAIMLVKLCNTT